MPQGRMFVCAGSNMTIASGGSYNLITLWTATTVGAAGSVIVPHRIEISQSASTTSTMVYGSVSTCLAVTGTGGTSLATSPLVGLTTGATASGISGSATISTAHSSGPAVTWVPTTPVILWDFGFNILNGYLWVATPPEYFTIYNNVCFAVSLLGTPGSLTGWNCTIVYEEVV